MIGNHFHQKSKVAYFFLPFSDPPPPPSRGGGVGEEKEDVIRASPHSRGNIKPAIRHGKNFILQNNIGTTNVGRVAPVEGPVKRKGRNL